MKTAYFPTGLADRYGISNLPPEHKLLLLGVCAHMDKKACGVIRLTDKVFSSLSFLPTVGRGVAEDLARRDLAAYNKDTREFFVIGCFEWNKTPDEAGAGSPWSIQVTNSLEEVLCRVVKGVVERSIEQAPSKKIESVPIPTNLLSALPRRGGVKWTASELLLLLILYVEQGGSAAGALVADFDCLGALCSLPPKTIFECCASLAAGEAILFDQNTSEIYVFARVKNALRGELPAIAEAVDNFHSKRLKIASKKHFFRTFKTYSNKSMTCFPKEVKRKISRKEGEVKGSTAALSLAEKGEQLLARGRLTSDANIIWDEQKVEKIFEFARAGGDEKVLQLIKDCQLPSEALRLCEESADLQQAARTRQQRVAIEAGQKIKEMVVGRVRNEMKNSQQLPKSFAKPRDPAFGRTPKTAALCEIT